MVFPKSSFLFPILSNRGCCLLLRPPILLEVSLPFLRCSGSLCSYCIPVSAEISSRTSVLFYNIGAGTIRILHSLWPATYQ
jgi:hypothetical protein